MPFKPGVEHVLAFHFVDQLSPLPPYNIKLSMLFTIQEDKDYDLYVKHVEEEPIYFTVWIVVGSMLTVLFWFLAIQNSKERNLTLIAVTSTVLNFNSIQSWIPHCNAAPFIVRELFTLVNPVSVLALSVLIPLLISRIFKRTFNLTLKIWIGLSVLSFVVVFIANYLKFDSVVLVILPVVLVVGLIGYIMFTSWKNLKGAQWAIVGGIGLTTVWALTLTGLQTSGIELSMQQQSILDSGILL